MYLIQWVANKSLCTHGIIYLSRIEQKKNTTPTTKICINCRFSLGVYMKLAGEQLMLTYITLYDKMKLKSTGRLRNGTSLMILGIFGLL